MSIYKWKAGARCNVDAQTAGGECARIIERDGRLTPSALVDASRDEDAPLHGSFEWRDDVAAERYRETQASYIIRMLEVEVDGSDEPVRAFVPSGMSDETRRSEGYADIRVVLEDEEATGRLLEMALRELEAFERKYKQLAALAAVFAEIDRLVA